MQELTAVHRSTRTGSSLSIPDGSRQSLVPESCELSGAGRQFVEGVPLAEVVCALMLTRQTLRSFMQTHGWMDSALDFWQQVKLHAMIDCFSEYAT